MKKSNSNKFQLFDHVLDLEIFYDSDIVEKKKIDTRLVNNRVTEEK